MVHLFSSYPFPSRVSWAIHRLEIIFILLAVYPSYIVNFIVFYWEFYSKSDHLKLLFVTLQVCFCNKQYSMVYLSNLLHWELPSSAMSEAGVPQLWVWRPSFQVEINIKELDLFQHFPLLENSCYLGANFFCYRSWRYGATARRIQYRYMFGFHVTSAKSLIFPPIALV